MTHQPHTLQLADRVYHSVAVDIDPGPLEHAHKPITGATEFELDALDWGVMYGVAYGIARGEDPFEPGNAVENRALTAARQAWNRWADSTSMIEHQDQDRKERGEPVGDIPELAGQPWPRSELEEERQREENGRLLLQALLSNTETLAYELRQAIENNNSIGLVDAHDHAETVRRLINAAAHVGWPRAFPPAVPSAKAA